MTPKLRGWSMPTIEINERCHVNLGFSPASGLAPFTEDHLPAIFSISSYYRP